MANDDDSNVSTPGSMSNPSHIDNLRHPSDMAHRPSETTIPTLEVERGRRHPLDEERERQHRAPTEPGRESAELEVPEADPDAFRQRIAMQASADFARVNANASREALEILGGNVAHALIGPASAYKERLLHSLIISAYIRGASFGTQLALEQFCGVDLG